MSCGHDAPSSVHTPVALSSEQGSRGLLSHNQTSSDRRQEISLSAVFVTSRRPASCFADFPNNILDNQRASWLLYRISLSSLLAFYQSGKVLSFGVSWSFTTLPFSAGTDQFFFCKMHLDLSLCVVSSQLGSGPASAVPKGCCVPLRASSQRTTAFSCPHPPLSMLTPITHLVEGLPASLLPESHSFPLCD